jgi:hypothetical protein
MGMGSACKCNLASEAPNFDRIGPELDSLDLKVESGRPGAYSGAWPGQPPVIDCENSRI